MKSQSCEYPGTVVLWDSPDGLLMFGVASDLREWADCDMDIGCPHHLRSPATLEVEGSIWDSNGQVVAWELSTDRVREWILKGAGLIRVFA